MINTEDYEFTEYYEGLKDLEEKIGREINLLSREEVEESIDDILYEHRNKEVAFVTPGDPMVATTHTDLILRVKNLNMETKIIHGPSIYSAVAETGLQIYKFGKSTSIVYPEEDKNYFPTSYYDVIKQNKNRGLHTLLFLDIQAKKKKYMSIGESIDILLKV
ncbi:MAG: diphthine synthase [Promethearchaeia archaeon]